MPIKILNGLSNANNNYSVAVKIIGKEGNGQLKGLTKW